jgi:hypothetical protein
MQREVAPGGTAAYRRIKQLIKEFKPDIVHTHAAKAGAVGRMAASDLGVKAIVHTFHGHVFHSYFGPMRTSVYKNIERFLARAPGIVAISDKQKQRTGGRAPHLHGGQGECDPLGLRPEPLRRTSAKRALFRRVYGVADDEMAIGIVGRWCRSRTTRCSWKPCSRCGTTATGRSPGLHRGRRRGTESAWSRPGPRGSV